MEFYNNDDCKDDEAALHVEIVVGHMSTDLGSPRKVSTARRSRGLLGRLRNIYAHQWQWTALRPNHSPKAHVLFAHQYDAIVRGPQSKKFNSHNQFRFAHAIARELLERGYAVDAISYMRNKPPRGRRYEIFIGSCATLEGIASRLDQSCICIAFLDTTHWLFNNIASMQRSHNILRQRNILVEGNIEIKKNFAIESADYGIVLGNRFIYDTFSYSNKTIFEQPNIAQTTFARLPVKDINYCRHQFLWLGSRGLAHKGLGLTLEAFARMPDLRLVVCGPLSEEPRFVQAYEQELFHTPNIEVRGWIDVPSPAFAELAQATLAHVFPSCAEAQAGAVLNCMQAGVIPIVSEQTSLDIEPDFGIMLPECTVEQIMAAVRNLAARPADALEAMRQRCHDIARTVHSEENVRRVFGDIVDRIVEHRSQLPQSGFVRTTVNPTKTRLAPGRDETRLA